MPPTWDGVHIQLKRNTKIMNAPIYFPIVDILTSYSSGILEKN